MRFSWGRRFGFELGEDPERAQMGSGCNGASRNRVLSIPNWGSWKAWLSIFCRCPRQLWEKLGQRGRFSSCRDTCYVLVVFLHEKGGRDSSSLTVPFADGVRNVLYYVSTLCGRCGHNHDTATTANDALADGKADIALLAREIYTILTLPTGPTQRCCDGETVRERVNKDCRLTRRNPLHFSHDF
ncbi:hypothetical protein BGY98DRAFT_82901 [Russula aff. rugulosa BPL654]|nr:hypothetical protein BGY98DRAFT_82901 [Russula aff. rugulosa BPL654]